MTDRPTASTITDDQLEALYAELDHWRPDSNDGYGHPVHWTVYNDMHRTALARESERDRARRIAVQLENENARLEARVRTLTDGAADREALLTEARDALVAASAGGHGNDWPHLTPGVRSLAARAEGAEQQLAQVRALHARDDSNPLGPWCGTCSVPYPCRTAAALGDAQQSETVPAHENGHTAACGDGRDAGGESRPEALTGRQAPAQRRDSRA